MKNQKPSRKTDSANRGSLHAVVSCQMLPCNKIENVRRRAERAMGGIHAPFAESMVTCPASRHLMMIADALAAGRKYHMIDEEPQHIAAGMYSVCESLWKARAKIKRLTANNKLSESARENQ